MSLYFARAYLCVFVSVEDIRQPPRGEWREALSEWTERCWKNNRGVAGLAARWELLRLWRCVVHCSGHLTAHIKLSQTHLHKQGMCVCDYTSLLFCSSVRAIQPSDIHFISISAGQVCWVLGAPPASGQIGSSTKSRLTGRWLRSVLSWLFKRKKPVGASSLASKVST